MTDDIILRAAKAITPGWETASANTRRNAVLIVRAVLREIREPTVAMYKASRFPNAGSIGDQWRAMIDAALEEDAL